MSKKITPAMDEPDNYAQAIEQLEQLVENLETGQLPLEQLLSQYQHGMHLLKYCQERLKQVEDQVKILQDSGELEVWKEE